MDDPEFAEALLRSVGIPLLACDASGRIVFGNDSLRALFGPGSGEVSLTEWLQRFPLGHHDGRPLRTAELPLVRALSGEIVHNAGLLATDRSGRRRWLTVNAQPVRDRDGAIVGAAAAVEDVTATYEARIHETCKTAVLEALAGESSAEAARQAAVRAVGSELRWPYVRLWLLDPVTDRLRPDACFTAPGEPALPAPRAFTRGEGLAGRCWERGELLWVPDIHAGDSPVVRQVRDGTRVRAAGAVPVRAGKQVTGVLTFYSYDPQEPEPGLAVLLTGIADNLGAHLQQHRADSLARHLATVTEEYVALAGHELRTPLTSITTYSELLADTPGLPSAAHELVTAVQRNSVHLRRLIDQLLDLAALDTGHRALADADVDLTTVTGEAVADISETAAARRITVTTEAAEGTVVRGDAKRLRHVVTNLLDNAIKFSPDGATVAVRLSTEPGAALLTVTDTGCGLPGDRTADLFRRLYRGDNARHTGTPGNGLGLALCQTIVERHHGTIELHPHDPQGTTAVVRLPAA